LVEEVVVSSGVVVDEVVGCLVVAVRSGFAFSSSVEAVAVEVVLLALKMRLGSVQMYGLVPVPS
jgi:hypothetical protein